MKQLRSFTIIELTISLLISAVAIGIAFYGFFFFKKQFAAYRQRALLQTEYTLFKKVFQHDIDNADRITDPSPEQLFLEKEGNVIVYSFYQNHITRLNQGVSDTFRLQNLGVSGTHVNDTLKIVENAGIHFNFGKKEFTGWFSKYYSARQLMDGENRKYE